MKKIFLPFAALFLLCSCASFLGSILEKPKVSLDRVGVKDPDLKGATLIFYVAVENPNQIGIKVDKINYTIFVNEKEVTKGVRETPVQVAAKGTEMIEIPMTLEYHKIFSNLKDIMFAESASYKIEGNAKVNLLNIPFTKEGQFRLR